MSKQLEINTARATAAAKAGNMELASKLFELCYLIAQAIAAGETEDTIRGRYLTIVGDMIAAGKTL